MADAILIPEIPFHISSIVEHLRQKFSGPQRHAIVVVAEGAIQVVVKGSPAGAAERLGGIGEQVARQIQEATGIETRAVTLGHLLRGGSPIAMDRILGLGFGAAAVQAVAQGLDGVMVALKGTHITHVPLANAIARMKGVPVDGMGVKVARSLGISLGDIAIQASA